MAVRGFRAAQDGVRVLWFITTKNVSFSMADLIFAQAKRGALLYDLTEWLG